MLLPAFPAPDRHPTLVTVSWPLWGATNIPARAGMLSEQTVESLYRRLQRRRDEVDECLVLATCARVELVAHGGDRGRLIAALTRALRDAVPPSVAPPQELTYREGRIGAHWLHRVAAGLESPILGEHEILGQLRDALADGIARQSVGPILRRLAESALTTGGRARQETGIARGSVSLARIAALALNPPDAESGGRALIVGAGRLGRQVALQLRTLGWRELVIASRTPSRADELARDVEGTTVELDAVQSELSRVDALVTAVSGDAPVLDSSQIVRSAGDGGRLRTVIDLGSPPNIACSANASRPSDTTASDTASTAGLRWIGLHDLVARADAARAARADAIPEVEALISRELDFWMNWWERRERRAVAPLSTAPLTMHRGND